MKNFQSSKSNHPLRLLIGKYTPRYLAPHRRPEVTQALTQEDRTRRKDNSKMAVDPEQIAAAILNRHQTALKSLSSVIRHPRSLARPSGTWRPPQIPLPAVGGAHTSLKLCVAITRYRVGPFAAARVRGFGETRRPAYLVSLRITSPSGSAVPAPLAEGWIRALVPRNRPSLVHELTYEPASTFVWLVDENFLPVSSPGTLFEQFQAAA